MNNRIFYSKKVRFLTKWCNSILLGIVIAQTKRNGGANTMATIRERNGTYQITVYSGFDLNGRRKRETTTFTPPKELSPKKKEKVVQAFAIDFENRIKNGLVLAGEKTTLREFVDRWREEYATQNLEPGTLEKYNAEIDDKILPMLGHMILTEIKPHNVNGFYVSMTKSGVRRDGKPGGYSKGTITKTANVLSSILKTAVDWEVINRNPCDKVRTHGEDVADKIKFFTPAQVSCFLEYIEKPYEIHTRGHSRVDDTGIQYQVGDYTLTRTMPEQLRVLFNLAVFSGLRKGEMLALQWSDIDFENSTVSVTKAAAVVDGKQVCKAPKTKNSRREVSIPRFLTDRLRNMMVEQTRTKESLGAYWKGNNWLFTQSDGSMMSYSTPYATFQDAIDRYNADKEPADQLPHIPFHGLRHTSATLLIAAHQDVRTVSNRLGHAQASTTMNIYAHALKENDRTASNALENMLCKSGA